MKKTIAINKVRASATPLVIKVKDLPQKTSVLFEKLAQDDTFQARFVSDPSGHVVSELLGQPLPTQQLSDANRVLFATLANDKFREWLEHYDNAPDGKRVSQETFAKDFAKAVLAHGDPDLLQALLKQSTYGHGVPGIGGEVFNQFVTGPDKTFVTSPATPSTSDQTLRSSQNFESSSQSNSRTTGVFFGDASVINPAVLRSVLSQLISHAKALQAKGILADQQALIR